MTRLTTLLLVLALAACVARPPGDPNRDLQWRTSIRGNEVRAVVFDRTGSYRIERVALVGPNGQIWPAREMTRENQGGSGPGVGLTGGYGSRSGAALGLGIGMPYEYDLAPPLERRTVAVIPLPDAELYRRTAAQWRIEIDMVTPVGIAHHATIPAPAS
jgi:DNA-binding transcriptional LysR family regulator